MLNFNEKYYEETINKYWYEDIKRFERHFWDISSDEMNIRFLCHKYWDELSDVLELDREKIIITTWFWMSWVPHLGTISQIIRIKFFIEHGIKSQIVIGDLDALNWKNKSLSYVLELSERYKKFIDKIINNKNKGLLILRDQINTGDVLVNDYLLSKYVTDEDFNDTEEDLHEFYAKKWKVDKKMTYRRKRSLMLMISDFISLFSKYDGVWVMLWIDEHKYVLLAQKILSDIKNTDDDWIKTKLGIDSDKILASLYTKLLRWFNGYPKQSKSFPDSWIFAGDSSNWIKDKIEKEKTILFKSENINYEANLLINLMIDTFYIENSKELYEFIKLAKDKDKTKIDRTINDFIQYLINLLEEWKKV